MMRLRRFGLLVLFILSGWFTITQAVLYDESDWVDFINTRYISSVAADDHVVYFGTTGGIIRYDRDTERWLDPLTEIDGLPSNNIKKLAYASDFNELWIETSRGTGKYNLTFESYENDDNFPQDLVINDWRASDYPSLFMPFEYNYNDGYITDPNFNKYVITVGYEEDFGHLMYIGTWGMGAAAFDTRHLDYTPLYFGPYNQSISRVIAVGSSLWMGTDHLTPESAITCYNRDSGEWKYYESKYIQGLDNSAITCGIETDGIIWFGTPNGLVQLEGENDFHTLRSAANLPSVNVTSLAVYGRYLYVGTENGIAVVPPQGGVPDSLFKAPLTEQYSLRGQQVNDMLVFDDILYIATGDGVYSHDGRDERLYKFDTADSNLAFGATDIFTDSTNLYFAANWGIVVVNPQTDSTYYAGENKYSGRWHVYELYANSEFIWAATNVGLWKYRQSDGYTYLYTTKDGLPVDEVNSLVADGDYFWLGTRKGLVRFYWNDPGRGD